MSIDVSTYVGPFAVNQVKEIESKRKLKTCPQESCSQHDMHMGTAFCHVCGTKVVEIEIPVTTFIAAHEVQEKIKDALTEPMGDWFRDWRLHNKKQIWIANRKLNVPRETYSVRYETGVFPFEPKLMYDEVKVFKEQFANELKIIEEIYGNISFEWGMIKMVW